MGIPREAEEPEVGAEEDEDAVKTAKMVKMVVVEEIEVDPLKLKAKEEDRMSTPSIRHQGMQICLLSSPATVTGPSGSPHISVWTRGHAPGASTSPQDPTINEKLTNSDTEKMRNIYMSYFTQVIFQLGKLIHSSSFKTTN